MLDERVKKAIESCPNMECLLPEVQKLIAALDEDSPLGHWGAFVEVYLRQLAQINPMLLIPFALWAVLTTYKIFKSDAEEKLERQNFERLLDDIKIDP